MEGTTKSPECTGGGDQPKPMLPRFPPELFDKIFDEFDIWSTSGDDYLSLSNFSIASSSKALVDNIQKRLLRFVAITNPGQADRLWDALVANPAVSRHIKNFLVYPVFIKRVKEFKRYEGGSDDDLNDGSSEDDSEDEYDYDPEEDEEENNGWTNEANPFENDSLTRLLSKMTSVEQVTLRDNSENYYYHPTERWYDLDPWIDFFSLPSIIELNIVGICIPLELLNNAPPNLKYLRLSDMYFHEYIEGALVNQITTGFNRLEVLEIQHTDFIGICIDSFLKAHYLNRELTSTTLRSLTLSSDGENEDGWAWVDTFHSLLQFGCNTLTNLTLCFPFGQWDSEFYKDWEKRSSEIGLYLTQLRQLEDLTFNFQYLDNPYDYYDIAEGVWFSDELQGKVGRLMDTAFTPYLPTVMDGLVKGRESVTTPFKRLTINMTVRQANREDTLELGGADEILPVIFLSFASSPIWRRIDSWLVDKLATSGSGVVPRLRVNCHIIGFTRYGDKGKVLNDLLIQPMLGELPKLVKAEAVDMSLMVGMY